MIQERLKNYVFFKEGPGLGSSDFTIQGVPLLRINNVDKYYVHLNGCSFISEETAKKYSKYKTKVEDLIISGSASFGIVSEINEETKDCIPYTGLIILRPKKGITKNYLKWFVSSQEFKYQIDEHKTGSIIQHFGPTHLKRMNINVCSIEKQNSVSNFLNNEVPKIDRKISILEQKYEKLEEYKQSIIFEAVTKGLDNSVPMKDSKIEWIGDIPAHWEVKRVKDVCKVSTGQTPPRDNPSLFSNNPENGILWIKPENLKGATKITETSEYISELGLHCMKVYKKDSIILSGIGDIGKIGISSKIFTTNQQNHILYSFKENYRYFLYYLIASKKYLELKSSGTVVSILNAFKLKNIVCLLPNIDTQTAIANFLDTETSKIEKQKELLTKKIKLL